MRKLTILLILTMILIGCHSNTNKEMWLQDYKTLKSELTTGYANLQEAVRKERIDLIKLNDKTVKGIENAISKKEAQSVVISFLKKFNDGHLRASVVNTISDTGSEIDNYVYSTDNTTIALEKMGFEKNETHYNIRYDSIEGYRSLVLDKNPFDAGIIDASEGKIGILKLHSFGHWTYWNTAMDIWESYRKKIDKSCDNDCQWKFVQEVESSLSRSILVRLEQLKNESISSLLLDVSDNGGGTSWYEEIVRFFSDKKLIKSKISFVKHKHWNFILKNHLKLIEEDLSNTNIKEELKKKLTMFRALVLEKIRKTESVCSFDEIWKEQGFECAELIPHPYAAELPFGIMQDSQFNLLKIKQILDTSRFLPFRRNVYSGPLYVVQDVYSASATEGFTSLLQLNNRAIIVGENSYGAGCGYTNGGISIKLKSLNLIVKMPDCSRYRKDGKNEIYGIEPDLLTDWNKEDSKNMKGIKVIESIKRHRKNQIKG